MTIENDVASLEAKWESWDAATRTTVADELTANELQRIRQQTSREGLSFVSESSIAKFEDEFRAKYDREREVEATLLESEAKALEAEIAAAIAKGATVPSERDIHATSTSNALIAGVLEELQVQRLRAEWSTQTLTEIAEQYPTWTDERDRTAVRLLEAAITGRGPTSLGVKADPDHDARALLKLQAAVSERRRARVSPALVSLQDRLRATRTMQRDVTLRHLRSGRGIARRPRELNKAV